MAEGSPEKTPEKTRFFSSLAARNLSSARMLWAGEVLGKNRGGLDIWRNVSKHCLVQTAGCEILGRELGLPEQSIRYLGLAAMGHDWDKKYQSQGLKRINEQIANGEISEEEGGRVKYDFFEESEIHNVSGMQELGIPAEIVKIVSADGHPALPRMMSPDASIEEKVLHYVGSITDESNIVPLDQRIDNLERNERYRMMNEYGRQVPWTGGRTLYEVQREVGHQIEKGLVQRLIDRGTLSDEWKTRLEANPEDLPFYIKAKVEEQYAA